MGRDTHMEVNPMTLNNPYNAGTQAHQEFSTYAGWYHDAPAASLVKKEQRLRHNAADYHRYGWKQMANFSFHADCIAIIVAARQA